MTLIRRVVIFLGVIAAYLSGATELASAITQISLASLCVALLGVLLVLRSHDHRLVVLGTLGVGSVVGALVRNRTDTIPESAILGGTLAVLYWLVLGDVCRCFANNDKTRLTTVVKRMVMPLALGPIVGGALFLVGSLLSDIPSLDRPSTAMWCLGAGMVAGVLVAVVLALAPNESR